MATRSLNDFVYRQPRMEDVEDVEKYAPGGGGATILWTSEIALAQKAGVISIQSCTSWGLEAFPRSG